MEIICEQYLELLAEFYMINSWKKPGLESPTVTENNSDPITNKKNNLQDSLNLIAKSVGDDQIKTVYESAASELRNMEHCLNFFIDYSSKK